MKSILKFNNKIKLSTYSLPQIINVRYSILGLVFVVLINFPYVYLIAVMGNELYKIIGDPLIVIFNLPYIILVLYFNVDFLHAKMGKQFIEVSDDFIRVKKFTSDKIIYWSDVKSIEEMFSVKFHIANGVKIKKRNKDKTALLHGNIVINLNKYASVDMDEFMEVLYREKSSNFRIRF